MHVLTYYFKWILCEKVEEDLTSKQKYSDVDAVCGCHVGCAKVYDASRWERIHLKYHQNTYKKPAMKPILISLSDNNQYDVPCPSCLLFPLPVISLHHVNRRSIGTFAPHNRRVQPFILAAVFGMISTIISLYKKKALFKVPVYSLIQVGLNSRPYTFKAGMSFLKAVESVIPNFLTNMRFVSTE
ncbi:hypothetical protein L3Y34_012884 [Caenorhabditis briggsae]|uniref:Uncharacterized protein n=1 Tax=Caenorhabditis briggsae TaxID=6238 RepID=A0AAE8ZTJ2_CAEBR|nr:hypothetical protein L3Y34_012884 [Caenorhabditis briggsae]